MNNLNSILIEGNLVRDPLCRVTPKGISICTFSIASYRYTKSGGNVEKDVSVFDIQAMGKLGEACSEMGHKGRGVRIVGRLQQQRWAGADGKPHTRVIIVAEHCEFRPDFSKESNRTAELEFVEDPPEQEVPELEEIEGAAVF